jgi:protein-disulfide isomerase
MALMSHRGQLDNDAIFAIAERIELDIERLKADMASSEIGTEIERNRALAAMLGIDGTPAFVIGDRLVPGAMPIEEMRKLLAAARSG